MSGIYYCDEPLENEWKNPPFVELCDAAPQATIDEWIVEQDKKWFSDDQTPSVPVGDGLEDRFRRYADKWDRDTSFMSATPMRVMHESYQSIMSMGPEIVPILLRDLQKSRRHWFWALRHLTGENPVPESAKGQTDKMIAAWIDWGKSKGKI